MGQGQGNREVGVRLGNQGIRGFPWSPSLLNLMERYFEWAYFVLTKNMRVTSCFFCARKQVTFALFLIWKRSEPFLEKLFSGLKKPIKLYRYVENVPCR